MGASSSVRSARGTGSGFFPVGVCADTWAAIADGATDSTPLISGWAIRPTCHSCMNIRPPAACTALAISAHFC
jgi:hypothetical protein